ncbi:MULTISPECIES: RteC domain-containing protein [Flagellimonas]|uniref:RteC domain-containing protein n=2 Tax=Flagellimonas TaxID=444459 RepID=A0ABT5XRX3_9FLAO|nr:MULTISPECIES: RteC domain-containing protein [Allomuricauda]MDF0708560.1 RteC domain-containing protein [[Muricauda] okinawensis]
MFYVNIINEFNEKIAGIEGTTQTELKKANACIQISSWALDLFKEQVTNFGFDSIKNEISFFKGIKCIPMKYLIYYTEIRSCELRIPKSNVKRQLSFLDKQTKKVNQFFGRHTEFLLYMEQGYDHFDEHYFTRKNLNNNPVVKSYPYYKDSIFNTSHDEIWARIKGLAMYANYLKQKKEELTNTNNKTGNSKLKWTGSYAALVEMLYGCQEMGYFNNGNVGINNAIDAFCEFLNVKKGNPTRTYQDLKARKGSPIKFFEETGQKLLQKMKDEDDLSNS